MFVNEDIPSSRKKIGWYEVNGQIYLNKYHALEQCAEGQWPKWNFHDDAYSQVPWAKTPTKDLYDLYRERALQLRAKYDNLLLYYSGGIDSHAVLRTFIDNDIKLDGIIVSGSYSLEDTLSVTCNMEQNTVARPFLDLLKQQGKLTCPVYYLDTVKYHTRFTDENWVYACGQSLTPQVYGYNYYWEEPWIQDFLLKGSTCFIRGVDKPRVILEDNKWYASFIDAHVMSGTPTGHLTKNQDWDIQEYFYWSPDCTNILHKQAHILIDWFEQNVSKANAYSLTTKDKEFVRSTYNNIVDPLIYGKYVNQLVGGDKTYFSLGKPFSSNLWHKDYWFFKARDVVSKDYQIWLAGLKMLEQKITQDHFNKPSAPKATETFVKTNNLGSDILDLQNVLFGTVGCWSKFHYIRDADFKLAT